MSLEAARHLATNGVPIFLAKPALTPEGTWDKSGGHDGTGYWLPKGWQKVQADPAVLDTWVDGMAVCAVMGGIVDLLDIDPRNGGDASVARLRSMSALPRSYGQQSTPSGGAHYFIASLDVHSRDGVMPGVDVKAGSAAGEGRGFAFIAPTAKLSKADGTVGAYEWVVAPDLEALALLGTEQPETGRALRELLARYDTDDEPVESYDGPAYADLDAGQKAWADLHVEGLVGMWRDRLREAEDWPEGERDSAGRGWEKLCADFAWSLGMQAGNTWSGLSELDAQLLYAEVLPAAMQDNEACAGKLDEATFARAARRPIVPPPWDDFMHDGYAVGAVDPERYPPVPAQFNDAYLRLWMGHRGLSGNWCWSSGLGWMEWNGALWRQQPEEACCDAVFTAAQRLCRSAPSKDTMALLSNTKVRTIVQAMRGALQVPSSGFDAQPDLLTVGNGVVDLRTGELRPFDRALLLTKATDVVYHEDALNDDWKQVLQCLHGEVVDWMRMRFGQAVTGYPTSDDVLPICQGGGANGKSTLMGVLKAALGDHCIMVPEKLLRASPSDHPTELMTLRGARLAFVDETPEVAQLNVQRLKQVLGQEYMTSREVYQNNVTWKASHSLVVLTNYKPEVRETDHGTWRRLALVRFERRFLRNDRFRSRVLRDVSVHEACLAWVVEGAREWYENGWAFNEAPARVLADTAAWRGAADQLALYLGERIVVEKGCAIAVVHLLDDFNDWLSANRLKAWSAATLSARMEHSPQLEGVYKHQTRDLDKVGYVPHPDRLDDVGPRPSLWIGLRWRTDDDE